MTEHEFRDEKNPPHDGDHGTGAEQDPRRESPENNSAFGADDQGVNNPRQRRNKDGYPHGEHYDKNTKYVELYYYDKPNPLYPRGVEPYGLVKRTDQKQFPQFHYVQVTMTPSKEDQNYQYGEPKPKILYNLIAISKAAPDVPLYIAEGEKDANTLVDLGLLGTCNSGGAGRWAPELNETCRGRGVFLCDDNDQSGRNHVHLVAGQLKPYCPFIKVLRFREFEEKGFDVTDWCVKRAKELFDTEFDRLSEEQHAAIRDELLARAKDWIDFTDEKFADAFLLKTKDDPVAPFAPEISRRWHG